MIKVSKIVRCIAISGLLLGVSVKTVAAFGFLPPMPGEPVNDPLTNVNKIFAYGVDVKNYIQTNLTQLKTLNLNSLKGFAGFVGGLKNQDSTADKPGRKTPGLGEFTGFKLGGLSIDPDSVNEQDFQDMYQALFLTYPAAPQEGDNKQEGDADIKYEVLKTAYRHKAKEYKQDVMVNTYVIGRYTEDYLNRIDNTLTRLDECIQGEKEGDDCIFFGMKVVKPVVKDENSAEEPQEGDNGQLGVAMNDYVVATIYDRLLRIVEDLTATEAIFRAAQQIDVVNPAPENEEEQNSNAADYLDNGLRFAYSDFHDATHAAVLIDKEKYKNMKEPLNSKTKYSEKCKGKAGGNCPEVNEKISELKSVKDTSLLKDLQYIDAEVNRIIGLHNLKSSLYEYKTQYRQYLMLKKIHEKAFKVLKESDKCAVNFLNKHLPQNTGGSVVWYGNTGGITDAQRNKYDYRQGLSGWLIDAYNQKSTQVTIGTNSECEGYYEVCPAGYVEKEDEDSCFANGIEYHTCVVRMVTQDGSETEKRANNKAELDEVVKNWKDTDGFMNGADSETIQEEARRQTELTWDIGRDGVMKFMSENDAQFDLWNDQKVFQAEYLRQKYRNMRLIIESADIGKLSYEIGTVKAGNDSTPDSVGISELVKHITTCQEPTKAVEAARQKYCAGYTNSNCTVEMSNGNIITKKYVVKKGKKELMANYPIVESQKVSVNDSCTYKNNTLLTADIEGETNSSSICLTPSCLVKKFYPVVLGGNSDIFASHNQRITAADYLTDVIKTRQNEEKALLQWIISEMRDVNSLKQELTNKKNELENINREIDKARAEKNKFNTELSRANERLNTIGMERNELNKRKKKLETSEIDKNEINKKLKKLTTEETCIKGNAQQDCLDYIKNSPDDSKLYMRLADAKNSMDKKDIIIKSYQSRLDGYKENIEKLEEQIDEKTKSFAKEYIVMAEKMQTEIENSNDTFENFMEDKEGNAKSYRMKTKRKEICYKPKPLGLGCKKNGKDHERLEYEDVATTLQKVIYYEGSLDAAIKKGLNDKFFSAANLADMGSLLSKLGVPAKFYVDNTFAAINLASGEVAVNTLIKKVKDALVEASAVQVKKIIETSDDAALDEIKKAVKEIKSHTDKYSLSGSTTETPNHDIYNTSKYKELREKHLDLLEDLRKPNNPETLAAGITDLSEVFGIPTKAELIDILQEEQDISDDKIYDSVYFVGLPARGNTYEGITADDKNAGRDFLPPKSPMLGLPPLREVFYFSAEEYSDIPQENGKPVLSQLLNGKYCDEHNICKEEYLPEIWLHLLASPNMRGDRQYQQTFVERSFARENINKLVKNQISNMSVPNADPRHYRTIIGRSGIYPCKTDNMIIDVDSNGDNVNNIEFVKRNAAPLSMENLPQCQEVVTKINNVCGSKSGKLCHLLADHGKNAEDTQDLKKVSTKPMYEKYSELGQLLKENLAYNPLQEKIQKYLQDSDENKVKNNIMRQKAERASFKRNIMGSFLNAAIAEDKANKAVIQNEDDLKERIGELCTQIHEVGIYLDKEQDYQVTEKRYADLSEVGDECADTIMKAGLAASVNDNNYDVNCNLQNDSYYSQIFCALDRVKDERLEFVKAKKKEIKKPENKLVVDEQLAAIDNLIQAMEKDSNEYVEILPDTNSTEMGEKIKKAQADRDAEIISVEEGLKSMENQTQSAAYCPLY